MKSGHWKVLALLTVGTGLFLFTNGNLTFAAAAWFYPPFILWVTRQGRPIYAWILIPLLLAAASQISLWKFTYDSPNSVLFFIPFLAGLPMGLIFAADRAVAARWSGPASTLAFPVFYTAFDFLLNLFNPFGTLGVLGYSQVGFLPYAQLASITGMWGLTFGIAWFGSVVVWIGRHWSEPMACRWLAAAAGALYAMVLGYGLGRLSLPLGSSSVAFSGIHVHDRDVEGKQLWKSLDNRAGVRFKQTSDAILERLEAATRAQVREGAQLVVWSELSPMILKRDEGATLRRLGALAKELKIHLAATPYTANLIGKPAENRAVLFSPQGEVLSEHIKFGGNFLEGTQEGDRKLKVVETAIGRLALLVCWDGDFPSVVRQVGAQTADLLIIPASDWRDVTPAHAWLAVFRGIENGCSVIRQTQNGLSFAVMPTGEPVATLDHFSTSDWIMSGRIPVRRLFVLYPIIGDSIGWAALAASAGILAAVAIRRPRS